MIDTWPNRYVETAADFAQIIIVSQDHILWPYILGIK